MFRAGARNSAHLGTLPSDVLAMRLALGYLLLTALIGGASRGDEAVLAFLRPMGIAMAGAALWLWPLRSLSRAWPLTALVLGVAVVCAIQLVPLPPDVWSELPGRSAIVSIDRILFDELPWRPLTMSSRATFNTLFYTLSLVGGLLVLAAATHEREATFLRVILAIAVASVVLAILQVQGGEKFYKPYRLMSAGPSGLFSNSNHFGMFCALGMLVGARLASTKRLLGARTGQWLAFGVIALLMLVGAFISTSRLAFGTAGIALLCSMILLVRDVILDRRRSGNALFLDTRRKKLIAASGLIAATILIVVLFVYYALRQREAAMGNFVEASLADSLRVQLAPILGSMMSDHWLAGIGFGSFADYYAIVEPADYVRPQYVNQAHNDFAQFVIEGGIAGLFILFTAAIWLVWRLVRAIRAGYTNRAILATGVLAIALAGSALDYVFRTPLFAFVVAVLLVFWLCEDDEGRADLGNRGHRR